ncbi:MAG: hypothetical protein M3N22_08560, partial [Acidobacteriota bacterium]|nr:hypothetical protein [Acidobacteriota bacterium]
REPRDYGKVMRDLGEQLLAQNVVYAEITLSIGVMLLRKQRVEDNFAAILEAARSFLERGLHIHFIFDAVRQFGVDAAMRVAESAEQCEQQCRSSASATSAANSIVAFGIGGDELSVPAREFRIVYDRAAEIGLHKLMHAGEIGGPQEIRDAIELLDVERIGHGIAAIRDPALMDLLADRRIPLEICPQSNIKTGALARQLDVASANIEQHPMAKLFRHGIPVVLSTDDPAMFHTGLLDEYRHARRLGLNEEELTRMADMSFEYGFMNNVERSRPGGSSAV